MTREQFANITKNLKRGGVKEACYIVKEYIDNRQRSYGECAVTKTEVYEAVKVLLAFSFKNSDKDTEVNMFRCGDNCMMDSDENQVCLYQFMENEFSRSLCPHYKSND